MGFSHHNFQFIYVRSTCRDWGIKKFQTENNSLIIKNPQFLPNLNETRSKFTAHEWVILTKFQWDWAKIVDFVLKENYFQFGTFLCLSLYYKIINIPISQSHMFFVLHGPKCIFSLRIVVLFPLGRFSNSFKTKCRLL